MQTPGGPEPLRPRLVAAPLDPAPPCGWFVYHRAPGKHRGRYEGPLDGLDAALALLRHLVEIELLLLMDSGRASSTYRIVRR
jgi:hypothetical protein